MTRQQFMEQLRARLSGLPQCEVEERLTFYAEMIDDRMEEGLGEEEAVAQIGAVEEVASQITSNIPLSKIAKEKIKGRRCLQTWEIVLLCVGAPIWLSLIIAAFAVVLSVYVSLWSVVVSLWASFGAIAGSALGGIIGGAVLAIGGNVPTGLCLVGAGIVLCGVSIFLFFGCRAATRGLISLTRRIVLAIKRSLIKKEGAI